MVVSQRAERRDLTEAHARRGVEEARARSQRFRMGVLGIWDRIVGRHAKLRRENKIEADAAMRRDASERQALIERQLNCRRLLLDELRQTRRAHLQEMTSLRQDLADAKPMTQAVMSAKGEPKYEPPRQRHRRYGPSL